MSCKLEQEGSPSAAHSPSPGCLHAENAAGLLEGSLETVTARAGLCAGLGRLAACSRRATCEEHSCGRYRSIRDAGCCRYICCCQKYDDDRQ